MSNRVTPRQRRLQTRPVLAVAATPGTTGGVRRLVRRLAEQVDIAALDDVERLEDAVLATSPRALDVVPPGLPVAVWVAYAQEHGWVRSVGTASAWQPLGSHPDVRLILSADADAVRAGATAVPEEAFEVGSLPALPPLVRARWRERLGLPARFVVAIEESADPAGDAVTNLALASAAVVSGPLLPTALALATPVVTTALDAERLGVSAGREVEVAEPDTAGDRDALAEAIAADDAWAARCSFAARRFAEQVLDIGRIADVVLDRLGLAVGDPQIPATLRVDQRLEELGTPSVAPIRARTGLALASLVSPADRS